MQNENIPNDQLNERLVPECYTNRQEFRDHVRKYSTRLNAIERKKQEDKEIKKEILETFLYSSIIAICVLPALWFLWIAFGS